jgi:pimeloyl-ACP methyl ester carboxylesterase
VIPKLWRDWSPGYDAADDLTYVFESPRGPARRRAAFYLHGEQVGCMDATLIALAPEVLAPGSRPETLPGVGHFLQLEDPARVNRMISDRLGSPGTPG